MTDRLTGYRRDITSQNGEDGMLDELLARLAISVGWCVEVGAWDGVHLSNTWCRWAKQGWSAVLIEGEPSRVATLRTTVGDRPVHVIEAFVQRSGARSLDALLVSTPLPPRFALLCIDVDGDDYRLWESLAAYRATIVVIEYNASFAKEMEHVQEDGRFEGASARSLELLGRRLGYTLVGVTKTNLIFVDDDAGAGLDLVTGLDDLFDPAWVPTVWSDFAGHHFVDRPGPFGYTAASLAPHRNVAWQVRQAALVARRRALSLLAAASAARRRR